MVGKMDRKIKALLVDDTEDAIILQTLILESNGYEVVSARNGSEGLEKLKTYHPDIIISDVLMPIMDGFEFCRQIKKDNKLKHIPVIFYSAQYTDNYDKNLAKDVGAEGFIVKPIETDKFIEKISSVLKPHIKTDNNHNGNLPAEDGFDKKHYIAQSKMLDKKLKELEEQHYKLLKSEDNYRRLIDGISSNYFLYRHGTDGIISYVSPGATDLLGYTIDEFCTHYETYLTDDSINKQEFTQKALQGEEQPPYELKIFAKNKDIHYLQVSEKPLVDENNNIIGIEGIAHDITSQKQLEILEEESNTKTHKALVEAIGAIALTVEKRDQYTAGHQQRVAKLSVMIGERLNLPAKQLEGLLLGATIHDIGKITIPIEILTKPTKLLDIEFELIKKHSEQGFDILKDVECPWPLSEMILQHHERLDGSGYPKGLKEDEIIIEAKIISVADVIEAISSHRPYRPALGLEAALEELKKNRGILYDSKVVDIAIEIMHENTSLFEV